MTSWGMSRPKKPGQVWICVLCSAAIDEGVRTTCGSDVQSHHRQQHFQQLKLARLRYIHIINNNDKNIYIGIQIPMLTNVHFARFSKISTDASITNEANCQSNAFWPVHEERDLAD